ncbi:glycoside hydrolase family 66 protein [Nakamurella aerolata]|uniref:Carbohydrate-binding protein n=1 Tax=Nakamurella aerolata TaxID=1656892 RepID=A0A849AD39_9ACTN|nr:glycoside hydrolase family 66 protein [Nakamurella aerolata]NNG34782.1 carbohydrate-binding protein [Nakamurella aerolata]
MGRLRYRRHLNLALAVATAAIVAPAVASAAGAAPPTTGDRSVAAATVTVGDAYVDLPRYAPGQPVTVSADLSAAGGTWTGPVTFTVTHLGEPVATATVTATAAPTTTANWTFTPPAADYQGYLVQITAGGATASAAVDVSSDWTVFPRIGFLSAYPAGLTQAQADAQIRLLQRKYHLNALQFYDWMWRHDKPIQRDAAGSLATTWTAWNGDVIAPQTVSRYITAAHQQNVAALPYSMSYAALNNYQQVSGLSDDWRLKYADGTPWDFEMIPGANLYMFDPANPSWQRHITAQYRDQVDTMGFDGVHVDQLGDWGAMTDWAGKPVDLPAGFRSLLQASDRALAGSAGTVVGMNAVDGFGSDAIATSGVVDYLYTELWDRHEKYLDVKALLDRQQRLSGGESRVIAGYLNNHDNSGPRYEAEQAVLSETLGTNTNHSGYTGPGFVDKFGTVGQRVEFTVTAPETRRYSLNFRYGNATGAVASRTVKVDGTPVGTVKFQPAGSWDTWKLPQSITTRLTAGQHTITLELTATDTGFINLDSLVLGEFDPTSVKLANAAFAASGASAIAMGQDANMLSNPYFPDFSKQLSNDLAGWMEGFYDFTTAYENLLYGPDVYSIDSGRQVVTVDGIATSGAAEPNTVWVNAKRSADHDVIQLINLLGNDDRWRPSGKTTPPVQRDLKVRYYIGPDLQPGDLRVASPDRDGGRSTNLPYAVGTDSAGRYLSFTVPELRTWDMLYLEREFATPAGGRYEAETAVRTGVTVGTDHPGYTGSGFVDNFAAPNTGVTTTMRAAATGEATLRIRYAAPTTTTRTLAVDGATSIPLTLPATGSWDTWATATVRFPLKAGLHSVVLWHGGTDSGAVNIDHLELA